MKPILGLITLVAMKTAFSCPIRTVQVSDKFLNASNQGWIAFADRYRPFAEGHKSFSDRHGPSQDRSGWELGNSPEIKPPRIPASANSFDPVPCEFTLDDKEGGKVWSADFGGVTDNSITEVAATTPAPVPEPSTLCYGVLGLLLMLVGVRAKSSRSDGKITDRSLAPNGPLT